MRVEEWQVRMFGRHAWRTTVVVLVLLAGSSVALMSGQSSAAAAPSSVKEKPASGALAAGIVKHDGTSSGALSETKIPVMSDEGRITVKPELAIPVRRPLPECRQAPPKANGATFVKIPCEYKYNLKDPQKALHDYCTASPDKWGGADFRGPCARHDLCIYNNGRAGKKPSSYRPPCDKALHADLKSNCDYRYGKWDLRRNFCESAAAGYYLAVKAKTFYVKIK